MFDAVASFLQQKNEFTIHTNCEKPGINNFSMYNKKSDLISHIELGKCNLKDAKKIFGKEKEKDIFNTINKTLVNALKHGSSIDGGNTTVYLHENFALRIIQKLRIRKKDNEYNAGYIQTYLSEKCDKIPKIYAIGMYQENRPFQLMEHVGTELYTQVVNNKEMVDVSLFKRCADTVKCMHDNDIVHRDIKPENITIKDNEMFVIDFGHANHKSSISNERCGTANYLPYKLLHSFYVQSNPSLYTIDFLKQCDIYMLALTMLFLEQGVKDKWWDNMTGIYEKIIDDHEESPDYDEDYEKSIIKFLHETLDKNIKDEKKRANYKKYINILGDEHTIDNFIEDFFPSKTSQGGNSRTHKSKKTRNKKRRKTRNKKRRKTRNKKRNI